MLKWFRITKNYYFGLFIFGLVFFALQELPYLIMPFIKLQSNVLMEMQDKNIVLNVIEKIAGISCIILLLFIVRNNPNWFSLNTKQKKFSFIAAITALSTYYIGWIFYFCGYQNLLLILTLLVAMPPIYYTMIGLWLKNYALSVIGVFFLLIHISNVWINLSAF